MSKAIVFAKDVSAAAVHFNPAQSVNMGATEAPSVESSPPPESISPPQAPPAAADSSEIQGRRVGDGIFVKADREAIGRLTQSDIMTQLGGHATDLRLGYSSGPDLRQEGSGSGFQGILITSISKGSIFEKIGIRQGDVIQEINGIQTTTPSQMAEALHRAITESGGAVRIEVERGDMIEPIYIEIN